MTVQSVHAQEHVPRRNPCELQLELYCRGIRIDESCTLEQDSRTFARTRAGLGSGLELVIPGEFKDIWMNAPVEEAFAYDSPYIIFKDDNGYHVRDERNHEVYDVKIPPEPSWYKEKTSNGTMMMDVGVLQGTYLGIYVGNPCGYWKANTLMCKFCTSGENVGVNEALQKSIEDVVEVCQRAKEESGITFVHFNSGFQGGDKDLEIIAPYVKAVKEKVGLLVGVQAIPARELWRYDWLIDLGADHFSFCFEFFNKEWFSKICPGKDKTVGQERFFRAMEYTSKKMGKGRVSGEIIAGVEPLEDTLRAIDYITDTGAFPTVCVFRPLIGAEMEDWSPPAYEDMVVVHKYMAEACIKKGIPVGLAPNIEVSLICQPTDAFYLLDQNDPRVRSYMRKLKFMKPFAQLLHFRKELKPHRVRDRGKAFYRERFKEPAEPYLFTKFIGQTR